MAVDTDRVTVRLTQQQIELLDRLKERGMGSDYSDVLLSAFRLYGERFLGHGSYGNVRRGQR